MLGYLRMASKVPTVIGQVVEGKIVSVTICHECQDVSNQCYVVLYNYCMYEGCRKCGIIF